jgi:biopolymer transport protein ExbD
MWLPSQAIAARAAKRRSRFYVNINVRPFISVMVALIILSANGIGLPPPHHGLSVDLPTALHASYQPLFMREDSMQLAIQRDGRIAFGTAVISVEDLPQLMGERVLKRAEKRIYLKADSRTAFGTVIRALESVRVATITDVTIITETPRP